MLEEEWLQVLGEEWSGFDNISCHLDDLKDSPFGQTQGVLRDMMDADGLALYGSLPDITTIYRGCYKNNKWGISWSLSKEVAEKFPTQHRYKQPDQQAILVTAQVKKSQIKAILLDRQEQEVLVWRPKHVSTRHIKTLDTV